MDYNLKKIGSRLKDERKEAGLSQDGLAMKLQKKHGIISRQTIGRWEHGEVPDLDIILSLCKLYDCDHGYLLCEYDYRTRKEADIGKETGLSQAAIESIQNMPPESLEVLNFLLTDKEEDSKNEEDFKLALRHLGNYKLACIRTSYTANKGLLKSRSLEERKEKWLEDSSNLDKLYNEEFFAYQSFEIAAKQWIRLKQNEVNELSFEELEKKIDEHLQ